MSIRKSTFARILLLSLICASILPATILASPCDLKLTVSSSTGDAVGSATMTVLPEGSKARSDQAGQLCVPDLGAGEHRLLIVADGFAVQDLTIEYPGEPLELAVVLLPAFGEEVVVTGTRTAKKLMDLPVHVQLVTRDAIESSAARTLADAVEWTAGVRVESNCQNCNFSQVRMLGLEGPYSQILVDGQPTVSSLALVYGIEQFPARLIDSLEIVKGGGSAVYGGGSVGGVINLIPHQPSHTSAIVESRWIETGGEPGESWSAVADWTNSDRSRSLSAFGQLDRVNAADLDGDGFSEVTRRKLTSYGLRFENYAREGRGRLTAEANFTNSDRRGGDFLRLDLPPDQTALAEDIATERLGASVGWLHTVSSDFDYRLTASLADTQRDSYYGGGFDPNAYGTTDNPLWVMDGQFNHYLESGTLTWGVQYTRDEIDDLQLGYGREIVATYTDLGLYLQDDREIGDRVSLLYGARVDRHSEIDDPIISPRLALMWSPLSQLTFRSSIARGFRPPVVFDEDLHIELVGAAEPKVVSNDPDLVEERSTAYLLSAEWRPTFARKGSSVVEVNLFRTELSDLFLTSETDLPNTGVLEFTRRNFGRAEVEGIEFAMAVRWGSRFQGELAWVQQSATFEQPEPDFGSRDFFRTPEQYGQLSLQWSWPKIGDFFAGALYTGSMKAPHYAGFIQEDRLETTPSFITFDLNMSRKIPFAERRELTLTLGVKNLTNEYQEDLDQGPDRDSAYVYGPRLPRSYFMGLQFEL